MASTRVPWLIGILHRGQAFCDEEMSMLKKNRWIIGVTLTAAFCAASLMPLHKETTGHVVSVVGQKVSGTTGEPIGSASIVLSTDKTSAWQDRSQYEYFNTGNASLYNFFDKDVTITAQSTPLQIVAQQVLGKANHPAWKAIKLT
jgi:hypothetical protein